eukprot:4661872-Alexandrium_andersonii.AAC.1
MDPGAEGMTAQNRSTEAGLLADTTQMGSTCPYIQEMMRAMKDRRSMLQCCMACSPGNKCRRSQLTPSLHMHA